MEAIKKSILCVDDDEDSREILTYLFEEKGFEVTVCKTLEECLSQAHRKAFSTFVLDNHFGNGTSLDVCREIRSFNPTTPIVFYSGEARPREIEKALKSGADQYLTKPLGLTTLIETVEKLVEQKSSAI